MSEIRVELRHKVEKRRRELERAFRAAERGGTFERRLGLEMALSSVDDAVERGWARMTEVGAEELSHWLDTTQYFVPHEDAAATKEEGGS
jgi:hypothetical protein